MSMNVITALVYLIEALRRCGAIDTDDLSQIVGGLGKSIFICSHGRLDHNIMVEALKRGPIILECERRRAHSIAKNLAFKLKKEVKKFRVGKRLQPIYLLVTADMLEEARKLMEDSEQPCLSKDGGECEEESEQS